MSLLLILLILLAGAVACILAHQRHPALPRLLATLSLLLGSLLFALLVLTPGTIGAEPWHPVSGIAGEWLQFFHVPWIPRFGIAFLLGLDGLAILMVGMTLCVALLSLLPAGRDVRHQQGLYYACLLLSVAGAIGVFTALDMFLFFFFWEAMLVPMYLMIGLWGSRGRQVGALKFFLYTQLSSLLLLFAILAMVFYHHQDGAELSFSYFELLLSDIPEHAAWWVMAGLIAAFITKSALLPLHGWLADAHSQAPTGASMLLTAIFLNTGSYGLLRFAIPFFPDESLAIADPMMLLGVITLIYGAMMAYSQYDMKRILAYASASHMGFVVMGLYAWNMHAVQGALMSMLTQGLTSAALFLIAGSLVQRTGTGDIRELGGLSARMPSTAMFALCFVLAGLGMPGAGNFIGKLLVLLGSFQEHTLLTVLATFAVLLSAGYALRLIQAVFHGPLSIERPLKDLFPSDWVVLLIILALLIWLGLWPQWVLDLLEPGLLTLEVPVDESGSGVLP